MTYKGMMFSDVPNLASAFGYTNASWTLKADLTAEYLCRLLEQHGPRRLRLLHAAQRDPRSSMPDATLASHLRLRAAREDVMPKQGSKRPWKLYQNYAKDMLALRFGKVDDGALVFSKAAAPLPNACARKPRFPRGSHAATLISPLEGSASWLSFSD